MDWMQLNKVQLAILDHTAHRTAVGEHLGSLAGRNNQEG